MDFLIAVNEKLANLEAGDDSRRLESNNSCAFIEPTTNWDEMPEEYATTAAQIVRKSTLKVSYTKLYFATFCRLLTNS